MTIVAIFDPRGVPETKIMRGLTALGEVGSRVCLGHGGPAAAGYAAPDLWVVCESPSLAPAETIAESYRQHGMECVRSLGVPCTFALYDRRKHVLVATSDVTSRVPLAYWVRNDSVAISSGVLRLLTHPGVGREVDEAYVAHIVTGYWSASPGLTVLRDVKRLTPGVALVAEKGRVQFIRVDEVTPLRASERAKDYWVGAFWRELEKATARCLEQPASCLSLSGGLDSAVVAAAAAPTPDRPLATFSMIAAGGSDERRAIDAVTSSFALVGEKVDCDGGGDLHDLDALELSDDPFMIPLSILPGRLRLWRRVTAGGFRTLLDGEGADELFAMPGPRHALVERQWAAAARHLRAQRGGRRFLFARSVLLPALPGIVTRAWARRRSDAGERLPSFMTAQAHEDPVIQEAGYDFYCGQVDEDLPREFLRWLSMPAVVGAAATHRHLASLFGLTLASPMLDRRVVEVILGIPAEHVVSPIAKAFLRDAAKGRVPDEVRTRPKDIQWSAEFLPRILGSTSVRDRLRDPIVRERLGKWIRFERLESMLEAITGGHELSLRLWQQIEGVVSCAYWYSRASREYGVQ
jgi:asparagine synthase (glutamine-hydrolysing)